MNIYKLVNIFVARVYMCVCKSCQSYFAVFDGHGGIEAAKYSATHLHCRIARHLCHQGTNVIDSMRKSFLETDEKFVARAKLEVNFFIVNSKSVELQFCLSPTAISVVQYYIRTRKDTDLIKINVFFL